MGRKPITSGVDVPASLPAVAAAAVPQLAGLYRAALGPHGAALAPAVRLVHCAEADSTAAGLVTVSRAPGPLARVLAALLHLPPAGGAVPVRLHIRRAAGREVWHRAFDGRHHIRTRQRLTANGLIEEQVGVMRLLLRATAVDGGGLCLEQVGAALQVGPLHLPVPSNLCPKVSANAMPDGRVGMRISVRVCLPGGRLLCHYRGTITPEES